MKTGLVILISLLLYCNISLAQDFRNVNWGDSPEDVKMKETAGLLKENNLSARGVESLAYVEFTDSSKYYTYTYIFNDNKLKGVRIKTAYLTDNTRLKALSLYQEVLADYQSKYENVKEEQKSGEEFKSIYVNMKEKRIHVVVKKENNEFYLLESIFKN
ncbi:MAG: hypothetical protein ACK40G_11335 [Cytophagaceae bacterium]